MVWDDSDEDEEDESWRGEQHPAEPVQPEWEGDSTGPEFDMYLQMLELERLEHEREIADQRAVDDFLDTL